MSISDNKTYWNDVNMRWFPHFVLPLKSRLFPDFLGDKLQVFKLHVVNTSDLNGILDFKAKSTVRISKQRLLCEIRVLLNIQININPLPLVSYSLLSLIGIKTKPETDKFIFMSPEPVLDRRTRTCPHWWHRGWIWTRCTASHPWSSNHHTSACSRTKPPPETVHTNTHTQREKHKQHLISCPKSEQHCKYL